MVVNTPLQSQGLRRGPSFFFRCWGGLGQFPKKILHSKKKVYNGSCTRKSAFYYPGPVFDFKKFLAQAIAHQIKTMHNLKGRKKISHQKIAQALPNP